MHTDLKPINCSKLTLQRKKSDIHSVGLCGTFRTETYLTESILNSFREVHALTYLVDQLAEEHKKLNRGLERGWWGIVTSCLIRCTEIEVLLISRAAKLGLLIRGQR